MPTRTNRKAAVVLTALLAVMIILVAATSGIGKPSVPDDAIAFVEDAPNGEITQEEFDTAIEQAAARQGTEGAPDPGTPQYDLLRETAMADRLLSRWFFGEAEERGIEIAEREVQAKLDEIIEQEFGGQKQFNRFKKQSQFSDEDVLERVELQLIQERIQDQVLEDVPEPSEEEISTYYDENIAQFETPETRDVRTLLNPDEAEAQDAFDQLSEDDSPASWKKVTKQLSTDEATASQGGLRQGVVAGQNEPQLDEAIFSATEGELVGPVETEAGFYVFQVETVNPASTQPLDEQTTQQIQQALTSQSQQEIAAVFQADFLAKWRTRTVCDEDYMIDRCGNAPPPPDACQGDDEGEEPAVDPATGEPTEGCPAPVPSTRPVPPSSAGEQGATGLPQGPQGAPVSLEGATPLGVPGAPGTAPGAPPTAPGAPPQGAAPPQAAP